MHRVTLFFGESKKTIYENNFFLLTKRKKRCKIRTKVREQIFDYIGGYYGR